MTKPRLVYVEWEDAAASQDWYSVGDAQEWAEEKETEIVQSVGWIVSKTKRSLVIAAAFIPQASAGSDKYGLLLSIPRAWIIKCRNLKI
jgi:hypothetical protein